MYNQVLSGDMDKDPLSLKKNGSPSLDKTLF